MVGLSEETKSDKPVLIEFLVFPENRWGYVLASEFRVKEMELELFQKMVNKNNQIRDIPPEAQSV